MMVVSLSNEPNAVGAIGTTGSMIYLVLNVLVGFAVGANVIVANRIGAREDDGVSKAVHTSLLIGLLFGIIGGVAGVIVDRPALYPSLNLHRDIFPRRAVYGGDKRCDFDLSRQG